jgi:DNA-binding response OmpR family regulator
VEDDQSVLEMYRLKLELDGYRVSTATDGEEGLRKAGCPKWMASRYSAGYAARS